MHCTMITDQIFHSHEAKHLRRCVKKRGNYNIEYISYDMQGQSIKVNYDQIKQQVVETSYWTHEFTPTTNKHGLSWLFCLH